MGFGTLFIGYFLLLNLTYFGFTDVIAASVMLLALYKLSPVNKHFKTGAVASGVFLAFSLCEFGISAYEMFFGAIGSPLLVTLLSIVRAVAVCTLTVLILLGIEAVAREVDVEELPTKAKKLVVATLVIYTMWIALEAPISFMSDYVLAVLSLLTILATLALIILNLTVIYTCYMKICMPGDEDVTKEKPSRFAFVNEYRARKAEREEKLRIKREEKRRKRK